MEELSFKPITGGLGFHKNKLKIDEEALRDIHWKQEVELPEIRFDDDADLDLPSSAPSSLSTGFPESAPCLQYRKPKMDLMSGELNMDKIKQELEQKAMLSKTLPRADTHESPKRVREQAQSDRAIDESKQLVRGLEQMRELEKRVDESKVSGVVRAKETAASEKLAGNWFAPVIDLVVVFGMVNLFMSSLLFVTKLDVFSIITTSYQEPMTQLSLGLLFLSICFLYTVISRSFFAATLGDWALDMELGSEEQKTSVYYPIRVSIRFILNLCTGFVLLPILSVLFRTDLAGKISGLKLYRSQD